MAWVNKPSIFVGDLFENKVGDIAEVLEYINARNIKVKFLGHPDVFACVAANNLRSGAFKNYMTPSVEGVGYIGGKLHQEDRYIYVIWKSMLVRCYSAKHREKFPCYNGYSVHKDWHNFQEFLKWYKTQEYKGEGFALDKDIIRDGNKQYSKDTCCLVPRDINNFFRKNIKVSNKGAPTGSVLDGSSLRVRASIGGKRVDMGRTMDYKEAEDLYRAGRAKEAYNLYHKWAGKVDSAVTDVLNSMYKDYYT